MGRGRGGEERRGTRKGRCGGNELDVPGDAVLLTDRRSLRVPDGQHGRQPQLGRGGPDQKHRNECVILCDAVPAMVEHIKMSQCPRRRGRTPERDISRRQIWGGGPGCAVRAGRAGWPAGGLVGSTATQWGRVDGGKRAVHAVRAVRNGGRAGLALRVPDAAGPGPSHAFAQTDDA